MIGLKADREIGLMAKAGEIAGKVFERLEEEITPGIRTKELDAIAADYIRFLGGKPAFLGYKGFPANICASINEVVVHGIPSQRLVKGGDILGVDIGVEFEGYFADAAATFAVGQISAEAKRLIDITERSLYLGIEQARPGKRLSDISYAVQGFVEKNGFSVVRAFVGHGIGSRMHDDPEIPNYCQSGKSGPRLEAGMALAIEPMVNQGIYDVDVLEDGWTAVTSDGKLSAHWEHTVVITKDGPRILTKWQKKNR
ncbi:MAG: type I methionyl aminopeptidase [Candidatus Omnitrophica bacterium]|nr:type I methionyl aminopeptidase [Candidatus Omnitrophota bacterium]